MAKFKTLVLLASSALAAGCTSLGTSPADITASEALVGVPYALPALQYDLAITRTLTKCSVAYDVIDADFETKVVPTPKMIAGEWFVADYRDLASVLKTSSLTIETYDNQTIKSVNASAEDRTAEVALGVVKAGITVAKLAAGVPDATMLQGVTEAVSMIQGPPGHTRRNPPTPDLFSSMPRWPPSRNSVAPGRRWSHLSMPRRRNSSPGASRPSSAR